MLDVALLGPLAVSVDGEHVEVPSRKASELLARLALEAGDRRQPSTENGTRWPDWTAPPTAGLREACRAARRPLR
jgi:hypothetical protein